jgi:hypothetical protein
MKLFFPAIAATLLATSAFAQTTTTPPTTTTPAPSNTMPSTTTPSTTMTPSTSMSTSDARPITLTEAEAKAWVNKVVVSSDGRNVGEVVAFARDSSGKVTEMHADIGGFMGLGETRIRLMPAQFKMEADRVILTVTAEQAKTMPQIAK